MKAGQKLGYIFLEINNHPKQSYRQIAEETGLTRDVVAYAKHSKNSVSIWNWLRENTDGRYEDLIAEAEKERCETNKRNAIQASSKAALKREKTKSKKLILWPAPRPNVPYSLGTPRWSL